MNPSVVGFKHNLCEVVIVGSAMQYHRVHKQGLKGNSQSLSFDFLTHRFNDNTTAYSGSFKKIQIVQYTPMKRR